MTAVAFSDAYRAETVDLSEQLDDIVAMIKKSRPLLSKQRRLLEESGLSEVANATPSVLKAAFKRFVESRDWVESLGNSARVDDMVVPNEPSIISYSLLDGTNTLLAAERKHTRVKQTAGAALAK